MKALEIEWPGGEHAFRLRLGEIEAVQESTGCGPEFLLNAFRIGAWKVAHAEEVLKFGLVGGGMPRDEAKRLIRATFDRGFGIAHYKPACMMILEAALFGPEDDPVGKPEAPVTEPSETRTDAGSSAASTSSDA
ncbi:gene transfer agent family protein [Sedimentimonas flavescens]|uniref:Gene transfer agent family protein n=1 Tax=Sedimentimonas flavescens TaxID=2851012 RepID=A0ABT2ZV31_9RHOB|nr:gene transfer agent family protein [Sedimentimonas flavescens]MCV2877612.1 gene transfer agent family protein [Sedimentimonas flavescens]